MKAHYHDIVPKDAVSTFQKKPEREISGIDPSFLHGPPLASGYFKS